jgi:DNA topoisomerase IA
LGLSAPRTEVRHIFEAQHADAPEILAALRENLPAMQGVIDRTDPSLKSSAFNDKKVDGTSHHGIVPTVATADLSGLTPLERNVYDMIVRSYLAQFYDGEAVPRALAKPMAAGVGFPLDLLRRGGRQVQAAMHTQGSSYARAR